MNYYTHITTPLPVNANPRNLTPALAEHTRYIVTFVFMLHQMTAGTGWDASYQVYRYCSTDWMSCVSPKCGLRTWYTTAFLGQLRISLKILLHNWQILHEYTNSSAPNNSVLWKIFQRQLANDTIFILLLPGTHRDVKGPWLAPNNATTLQLHISYIWGNQPDTAAQCRGLPHPERTSPIS